MDNATWAGHTISVYAKCKRRCVQCGGQLLKTEKKKDKTKTNIKIGICAKYYWLSC